MRLVDHTPFDSLSGHVDRAAVQTSFGIQNLGGRRISSFAIAFTPVISMGAMRSRALDQLKTDNQLHGVERHFLSGQIMNDISIPIAGRAPAQRPVGRRALYSEETETAS